MAIIKKKTRKDLFEKVKSGQKRFEVRLADFECKPGDVLLLQEQAKNSKELTGRELRCDVLFRFNTKDMEKFYTKEEIEKYGLMVLSIKKVEK